ncbi:hypothetical protein P171DRAFT_477653 [Karstenula rhodostoma CBS 690.94]|uniref:DUF6594 domain-containing protein n=1 Tax=Karstenula rhodostoma CBS 690.94 TaxID=1392251 RepID=A0A9P4P6B7_9PLEO|nr:hypothetical protein P171DRAFT_477653 [Karstenula rhodostoma CBS 690.94]
MIEKAEPAAPTFRDQWKWQDSPIGYPKLAERIAVLPETGIYRRFDALNARNLLYLQSELCTLENAIREQEERDQHDKRGNKSKYATDHACMLNDAPSVGRRQLNLVETLRKKISQYNKALIQQSKLQRIHPPDRFDLSNVQAFLQSEHMKNDLVGEDSETWGNPRDPDNHPPDLIGIKPRRKEDTFSRLVAENAVHLFKCGLGRFTKKDRHLGRKVYYDTHVMKATVVMTSILASLIPIASIWVLVSLHSLKHKMIAIAAFNVLISTCLTFFTDARRTDVFAVTAA